MELHSLHMETVPYTHRHNPLFSEESCDSERSVTKTFRLDLVAVFLHTYKSAHIKVYMFLHTYKSAPVTGKAV